MSKISTTDLIPNSYITIEVEDEKFNELYFSICDYNKIKNPDVDKCKFIWVSDDKVKLVRKVNYENLKNLKVS
tara:strand:- start:664 stop:882 length:219 start_codon:yes stop_codon:yes gene_type:complete